MPCQDAHACSLDGLPHQTRCSRIQSACEDLGRQLDDGHLDTQLDQRRGDAEPDEPPADDDGLPVCCQVGREAAGIVEGGEGEVVVIRDALGRRDDGCPSCGQQEAVPGQSLAVGQLYLVGREVDAGQGVAEDDANAFGLVVARRAIGQALDGYLSCR